MNSLNSILILTGVICAANPRKGRRVRVVRIPGRLKRKRRPDSDRKNHSRVKITGDPVRFKPEFPREQGAGIVIAGGRAGRRVPILRTGFRRGIPRREK